MGRNSEAGHAVRFLLEPLGRAVRGALRARPGAARKSPLPRGERVRVRGLPVRISLWPSEEFSRRKKVKAPLTPPLSRREREKTPLTPALSQREREKR